MVASSVAVKDEGASSMVAIAGDVTTSLRAEIFGEPVPPKNPLPVMVTVAGAVLPPVFGVTAETAGAEAAEVSIKPVEAFTGLVLLSAVVIVPALFFILRL